MPCVSSISRHLSPSLPPAVLSDEPDAQLNLMSEDSGSRHPRSSVMSIFSFAESYSDTRHNPYDISRYIDRVSS